MERARQTSENRDRTRERETSDDEQSAREGTTSVKVNETGVDPGMSENRTRSEPAKYLRYEDLFACQSV
jgi:hypothetical protein